jgi:hypothetical protein
VEVPHRDRTRAEQRLEGGHAPAASVDARGEHAGAALRELADEGEIRGVVHGTAEEHFVPFRQVIEHVERADLVTLVGRKRQSVCEQQDAHEWGRSKVAQA